MSSADGDEQVAVDRYLLVEFAEAVEHVMDPSKPATFSDAEQARLFGLFQRVSVP